MYIWNFKGDRYPEDIVQWCLANLSSRNWQFRGHHDTFIFFDEKDYEFFLLRWA